MDKNIVKKYFNNTCTVEQAEEVIEWLGTEEGQTYLAKRLDEDTNILRNERIRPMLPEVQSGKIWSDIEGELKSTGKHKKQIYHRRSGASYGYAAVIVLLVCGLAVFYGWNYGSADQNVKNEQVTHIVAKAHQHKKITLGDGTKITLNSNSELWVSATYGEPKRGITLKGEAYFEVKHNPAKPFIIHANGLIVKDLGTAFNVRAIPGKNNVQVAVKDGIVSILQQKDNMVQDEPMRNKIKITAGEYAYVNLKTNSISANEFEITNYFSWMNGWLRFNSATLVQTSKQLSHMYDVTFSYSDASLKTMRFSANFERESLKKTLSVIALTLSIDYQMKNQHVVWK